MRNVSSLLALFSSVAFASGGCRQAVHPLPDFGPRPQDAGFDYDAGSASGDAGDAGATAPPKLTCDGDAGAPVEGGLTWGPGVPASVARPQSTSWIVASTDPECAGISPGHLPSQLSWGGPDATKWRPVCDPPVVDGQGDLSVAFLSDVGNGQAFFRADGSGAAVVMNGTQELQLNAAPRASGFVLPSTTSPSSCRLARLLGPDAAPTVPILVDYSHGGAIHLEIPNPLGGYLLAVDTEGSLELRWVDDALAPLSDWQTALNWDQDDDWRVMLDQQGRALVLSFAYPPSFGPPPPPSTWKFSARWLDVGGPIGSFFSPVAPTFTSSDGNTVLFANWTEIVPLPTGGFVTFHAPAPQWAGGTVSPTGWYAYYPSGQPGVASAPSWLHQYDGSLRLLTRGKAYAALQRDPNTCARTVLLIAPSGRTCFTLPVDGTDSCDFKDAISPDGTLVLQNNCQLRWWPGLARPTQ